MFIVTKTELLRDTYAHVYLLGKVKSTLLTRSEYDAALQVTPLQFGEVYDATLPVESIEQAIRDTYGSNPQLLAEDIATADTLAADMDDAFAVRHFAERLNVGFAALFEWAEYDGYYAIGAIVGYAVDGDAEVRNVRRYLPPTLHGYVMTEAELDEADALIRQQLAEGYEA